MSTVVSVPRIQALAAQLEARGLEAFFAWSPITMGYLHGFFEHGHERFLTLAVHRSGRMVLIAPALSATQAERVGIRDIRPWSDGQDPLQLLRDLAAEWNLGAARIGLDEEMPAHMVLACQATLPGARFELGGEAIAALRRIKSEEELALMRRAGHIADQALPAGLAAIRPGATEIQVAEALREEMRRLGGKPTFCIVATGAGAAEPHHLSDDTVIRDGDIVLMDFGCEVEHYQSDITRTVCCGGASEAMRHVYGLVLESHHAGRRAIAPGIEAQAVDAAARRVIEEAGYGDAFFHRLGHGIGMEGHETPNLVAGNSYRLEPGNCFSVEPGIYLAGQFGIRIENIVAVTVTGHESLNEEPADRLVEVG